MREQPTSPVSEPEQARGAEADVGELFRLHHRRLLGLATAITLDRSIAEEVVQDAFVGLHRHVADVRNPAGYLQRSVVNLAVTRVRRLRRSRSVPLEPSAPPSTPEIDEAWTAVARLPAHQRAVVVLRYWDDMTIDAIASVLGRPAGSVKSTLHRALKRLEKELS